MRMRLLTTISLGLLSAACQSPYEQRYAAAPVTPPVSTAAYASSEQACADYGFNSGTVNFDRCVSRERAARSTGRVDRDYAQARLTGDARDACSSYGLDPGSTRYERCVGREVDSRAWREGAVQPAPTYRTDQNGNRIDSEGYRVDANGYRMARQSAATPDYPVPPTYADARPVRTGQPVSRDEFGFRYDQYGNRVDARGRVINP